MTKFLPTDEDNDFSMNHMEMNVLVSGYNIMNLNTDDVGIIM